MARENSNLDRPLDDGAGIIPTNFSLAFEQMCNFVAVARTGDPTLPRRGRHWKDAVG